MYTENAITDEKVRVVGAGKVVEAGAMVGEREGSSRDKREKGGT